MATYTAIVEQAEDSSWSAYVLSPSLIIGLGENKEKALADLRSALAFWRDDLKAHGAAIPAPNTELISIEVAA